MTKDEIARNINYKTDLCRIIILNYEDAFKEGEIYDNQGKAESWMCSDGTENFQPELLNGIEYDLYVDDIECHKVNYNSEAECDVLGATGCEVEGECLLSAETKLRVTSCSYEDDMRCYVVHLKKV